MWVLFLTKHHRAVGKESGKTSYIERFNATLRRRISSKTLSLNLTYFTT